MYRLSALLGSLMLVAAAWSGDLSGPSLGIVGDPRAGLRMIRGVPGAATFGDTVDSGAGVLTIAIAPRQVRWLAADADGVRLFQIQPDGAFAAAGAAPIQPSAIGFSPSGSIAGAFDPAANAISLWGAAVLRVDAGRLPDAMDLLAISDRAGPLLAGTLRRDHQSVYVLDGAGAVKVFSGFQDITDVTFLGAGADLAVCDRGAGRIFVVRDPLAGGAQELALDLSAAAQAPARIASSSDGNLLAVMVSSVSAPGKKPLRSASPHPIVARASTVGLLRLSDRQWTTVECPCAATSLAPLSGNAVFRLTDRTDQPLWILDADGGAPGVVFVPAVRP